MWYSVMMVRCLTNFEKVSPFTSLSCSFCQSPNRLSNIKANPMIVARLSGTCGPS